MGTSNSVSVQDALTRSSVLFLDPQRWQHGSVRWGESDLVFPVSGDFDLGLERYYHSFDDQSGSLGCGWSLTPYGLRFAGTKRYYICTKTDGRKVTRLAPYRVFVREG